MHGFEKLFWKVFHNKYIFNIILSNRYIFPPNSYNLKLFYTLEKSKLIEYVEKWSEPKIKYLSKVEQSIITKYRDNEIIDIPIHLNVKCFKIGYHGKPSTSMIVSPYGEKSCNTLFHLNVFFVIDVCSPYTYFEECTLKELNLLKGEDKGKSYPVKINGFQIDIYKSPDNSGFKDFNILGNNFLSKGCRFIYHLDGDKYYYYIEFNK